MSLSLDDAPLRDLCKEAERLTRELVDHLERNQIPKTREMAELVKPDSPLAPPGRVVPDITIRSQMAHLIESQDFAAELMDNAVMYFNAIDKSLSGMISG